MLGSLYTIEEDPPYENKQQQLPIKSSPSLLGCFGGIDVTVEQCTVYEPNVGLPMSTASFGRLKQRSIRQSSIEETGACNNRTQDTQGNFGILSSAGESRRLLLGEDSCDDEEFLQKRSSSASSKATRCMKSRMGVVKSKLKSSTRCVAAKLKKACEHVVEVAHKSVGPHMVDLFLNNHLLAQLSAVPAVRPPPPPPPVLNPFPCHHSSSYPPLCSCSPPSFPPRYHYYSHPF